MNKLLVVVGLIILSVPAHAQEDFRIISGLVTDGQQVLENVNVDILNSKNGTTTDSLGRFQITANRKDVLRFTHVGMLPIKLKAKKLKDSIVIEMQPMVERLKEVTVKGKAKSKQKLLAQEYPHDYNIIKTRFGYLHGDRTAYTIRIIEGDKLFKGSANFLQALRVFFPQIRVTSSGVYLRPNNSLRSTQSAAFELDGMFLISPPTEITISEIDRIAIISSSSIAARYGAMASGGMIIINTKGSR